MLLCVVAAAAGLSDVEPGDEASREALRVLEEWARTAEAMYVGPVSPAVVGGGRGRGLVATERIRTGQRLATVPLELSLTAIGAASGPLRPALASHVASFQDPDAVLAVQLLYELYVEGEASR